MLWFMQKPNEKLLSLVIILLWEVIYVHLYNWDCPLDFVPTVYNLIELIIELLLNVSVYIQYVCVYLYAFIAFSLYF